MEPHHFFTAQRVLIVAGKGGVGKSAVAAGLALVAARAGLRTLLVSLDAESIEVPEHELLERMVVTPGRALTDYLSSKGMGLLSRQLSRSGIVELVATTAPGLDDLLVLGRIKAFEREDRADIIIVDGPAAGHASDLVRAPIQLKKAISTGPIGQQADEVLDMLADPARCRLMLVTTPAMTPVSETLDVAERIRSTVNMTLTPFVVNKCEAPAPVVSHRPADGHLAQAYDYAHQRERAQRDAIDTLQSTGTAAIMYLPRLRTDGSPLVTGLADALMLEIEGLE